MGLSRINKPEPLAKKAFKSLRDSILTNELTTGVVYNEKRLASDLGISRTPVREALLELASKRLIKFLPQKGVVINTFSIKDIEDVFEIRQALEIFAIKKICLNHKETNISLLTEYLNNQKDAARTQDATLFMEIDRMFHIGIIELTRNDFLLDMMNNIRDIMQIMGFRALSNKERMKEVIREHENILKAVAQGNSDTAAEQMEHHLCNSKIAVNKTKLEETANG